MVDLTTPTPTPPAPTAPEAPTMPPGMSIVPPVADTFSQEQVEKMIQERVGNMKGDLDSSQSNFTDALKELEAMKKMNKMSSEEKTDLESRLSELQDRNLTQEQIASRDLAKANKEREDQVSVLNESTEQWKKRFFDAQTNQAITDAAVTEKAYQTQQIQAILHPMTQVTEELNDDGDGLGTYSPRVQFPDVDTKTGKPVTVTMTVADAVKRMKELQQFANLFQGTGVGGLGDNNQIPADKGSVADIAKLDPATYQQYVKDGKI